MKTVTEITAEKKETSEIRLAAYCRVSSGSADQRHSFAAQIRYYTEFVKQTPSDSIILTLACGKFRFNDLNLGEIGGLPRLMDMGQCNDAYGAIQVAVALANAFGCSVNELPLSFVLSWYEQKAVCILLTLLHLGIKNIRLGPSLPAFLSPNILNFLVENYGIAPITTPEEDLKALVKHNK